MINTTILEYEEKPDLTPEIAYDFLIFPELFKEKRILEVGPGNDARYSKELVKYAKEVIGVDLHPANPPLILKLLDNNPKYKSIEGDITTYTEEKFDVIFHVGVLYHLGNPIEHLQKISKQAPILVLDTHYSRTNNIETRTEGGGQRGGKKGITSQWLPLKQLIDLLQKNYDTVEMIKNYNLGNNRRVAFLCKNNGK